MKFPNFGFPVKFTGKSLLGTVIYTPSPPPPPLSFQESFFRKSGTTEFFLIFLLRRTTGSRSNMSCYTVISSNFQAVHPEKTAAISRRHYQFPREMTSEQRVQKFHIDG